MLSVTVFSLFFASAVSLEKIESPEFGDANKVMRNLEVTPVEEFGLFTFIILAPMVLLMTLMVLFAMAVQLVGYTSAMVLTLPIGFMILAAANRRNPRRHLEGTFFSNGAKDLLQKQDMRQRMQQMWFDRTLEDIDKKYFDEAAHLFCMYGDKPVLYLQPDEKSKSEFILLSIHGQSEINNFDYTNKLVTYKCTQGNSDEPFKECKGLYRAVKKGIKGVYDEMRNQNEQFACSYANDTLMGMIRAMEGSNRDNLIQNPNNDLENTGQHTDKWEQNRNDIVEFMRELEEKAQRKQKSFVATKGGRRREL